jgi:tRNA (mo5U34)-methyltransferase
MPYDKKSNSIEYVKQNLQSDVIIKYLDVHDMTLASVGGAFDITFFFNVFYHLENPLLALRNISSVTNKLLIMKTYVDDKTEDEERPMLTFYPNNELGNDFSNWWGPNLSACIAMLQSAGFSHIYLNYPVRENLDSREHRPVFYAYKGCPVELNIPVPNNYRMVSTSHEGNYTS